MSEEDDVTEAEVVSVSALSDLRDLSDVEFRRLVISLLERLVTEVVALRRQVQQSSVGQNKYMYEKFYKDVFPDDARDPKGPYGGPFRRQ